MALGDDQPPSDARAPLPWAGQGVEADFRHRPYVPPPDPRYRQELRAYTPPPMPFRPPVPLMERVRAGRPISPTREDRDSIELGGRIAGHLVQGLTDIPRNMMHLSTLDEMSVPEEYSRDPQAWSDAVRRARAQWGAETALELLTAGRFQGAAPRGAIGMNGGGRPSGPPAPPNPIVGPDGKLAPRQGLGHLVADLEDLGGGIGKPNPTPKGASQFIYPNGTVLRFDLEPGQYLPPGQVPHINLQNVPGTVGADRNQHIKLKR
jgi:hypothetical protein